MTPNLRVGFKERQRKCLFESLLVAPLPAKRTCSEVSPKMPVSDAHLVMMPPSDVVGSDQALVVSFFAEKNACPVQEKTSISQTLGNDLTDKDASVSSLVSGSGRDSGIVEVGHLLHYA